jgi:hypothetical protein
MFDPGEYQTITVKVAARRSRIVLCMPLVLNVTALISGCLSLTLFFSAFLMRRGYAWFGFIFVWVWDYDVVVSVCIVPSWFVCMCMRCPMVCFGGEW